jgi:hypothetical protein
MLDAAVGKVKGYANVVLVRGDAHELPFGDGTPSGSRSGALRRRPAAGLPRHPARLPPRPVGGQHLRPGRSVIGRVAAKVAGIAAAP